MIDTTPSPKQGLPKKTEETENLLGGRGTPRKTPKTSHFIETVDNLLASLRESMQNHGPIYTENGATPRRSKDKKWYRFNSQRIRRDIARSLGKLFDEAKAAATRPWTPMNG